MKIKYDNGPLLSHKEVFTRIFEKIFKHPSNKGILPEFNLKKQI
jgi:hypothetical protein